MARFLAVAILFVSLAALGSANLADFQHQTKDKVTSHKGETNQIDHGPQVGSFKPKHFHAYNHFGRKGEQMWRKLSDHEKKRYLKKLRKFKLNEQRDMGVASKDANDDVRLQHLDFLQNVRGQEEIRGQIQENRGSKRAKQTKDLGRRKKYPDFYAKKSKKMAKKQHMKKKHLTKKNQRP